MSTPAAQPWPSWLDPIVRTRLWAPLCLLYFLLLFSWAEFSPQGLYERDGYFHARYAQLLPERGLSREFPWTQASTWREHFCDKEFLYHALLVPFCRDAEEPVAGAKVLAVILALSFLAGLWVVLRLHHVPYPLLCTFLFACLGGAALHRLGMIRSHVLSMLLFLLGLHLMLRGRWKTLAGLGFVYAWSYTFPWVLPITAAAYSVGRKLGGGGWSARLPAAALAGVVAGSVLHPYFPGTVENLLTYLQVIGLTSAGRAQSGMALGHEFYAFAPGEFMLTFTLLLILAAGFAWALGFRRGRITPESSALCAAALLWFAGCVWMPRMIEYAAPAAVLAAGFLLRDLMGGQRLREGLSGPRRRAWLAGLGAAAVILAAAHSSSVSTLVAAAQDQPPRHFTGAAKWMKSNLQPGETVMNLWWDDFPELFYDAPGQHYLCGLDPTYMLRWNEDAARGLEEMRARRRPLDGVWLERTFGSSLFILRRKEADAYPELSGSDWKILYRDECAALYRFAAPAPASLWAEDREIGTRNFIPKDQPGGFQAIRCARPGAPNGLEPSGLVLIDRASRVRDTNFLALPTKLFQEFFHVLSYFNYSYEVNALKFLRSFRVNAYKLISYVNQKV